MPLLDKYPSAIVLVTAAYIKINLGY